jgi:hypothetical protein
MAGGAALLGALDAVSGGAACARGVIVAALLALLAALALGPRAAVAGCALNTDPNYDLNYMGLMLASPTASGSWSAHWQGAHPLTCDGDTYVVAVSGDAWAALQQAASGSNGGDVLLVGDFPYIGDGTCIPGTARRWWQPDAAGEGVRWQPASVPPTAPAVPCPTNQPGDAPLVVQPAG